MNKILKGWRIITSMLCSVILVNTLHATHIMGADITYRELDTNTGKYGFKLSLYRDCAGISYGSEQLVIRTSAVDTSVSMTAPVIQEVTPICLPPDVAVKPTTNCPAGAIGQYRGVERWVFYREFTLGKNIGWAYVGWGTCCRNNMINTIVSAGGVGMWIQAVINTNYRNNSPIFTTPPIPYWCRLRTNVYNHGVVDSFDPRFITLSNGITAIRDSFGYRLYTPFTADAANINAAVNFGNTGVTFVSGLNQNNFLFTTNGVKVDPRTGSITCIPSQTQDANMAMAVQEYRAIPNGSGGYTRVLVGYVCRDIQFIVRNECPPIVPQGVIEDSLKNATKVNFYTVNVCSSKFTQINFKMFGDTQEFLKYRIHRTPNSTSVSNYSNTITIDRKNQVDTLHCRITFDSIKNESQEIFELEAYYCTNIGIKISQFYTLVINLKQCSYTFNAVACDSYYWAAKNKTYTSSNNSDTIKFTNIAGGDSVVTLDLTIKKSTLSTFTTSACGSYYWPAKNKTYTNSNNTDTVKLINAAGCDSIVTLNLTIKNATSSTFTTSACDSYYWAAKNKTYTTSNNTDTVKLINAAGCDSIVTLSLTIYPNPIPTIIKTGNVLSTQSYITYQWFNNGSNISGALTQTYTAATNGNYQVEVTDANNCKGISTSLNVIVSSLNEVDKDCFKIYPTPSEKMLHIETNASGNWQASITDMKGSQIKQIQFNKSTQLDISSYAPGVYYIQLTGKENVLSYKFIKK